MGDGEKMDLSVGRAGAGAAGPAVFLSAAAPGVRLPRGGKVARALCTGIALLLVAVARFCARGCYGGFIIETCYSAAFIEPRALFLPIAALLALTLIARLCRER